MTPKMDISDLLMRAQAERLASLDRIAADLSMSWGGAKYAMYAKQTSQTTLSQNERHQIQEGNQESTVSWKFSH